MISQVVPRSHVSPVRVLVHDNQTKGPMMACQCRKDTSNNFNHPFYFWNQAECTRREQMTHGLSLLVSLAILTKPNKAKGAPPYSSYSSRGTPKYELSYPSTWEVTSKAGADVLLKDPERGGTTLGVTILPVRIESVDEYGSVVDVGQKIIAAEKSKESTISASIVSESTSKLQHPAMITVYDYIYDVESTRGSKRVTSRVFILMKQLYVINGTISCGKEGPCGNDVKGEEQTILQVTQSFRLA